MKGKNSSFQKSSPYFSSLFSFFSSKCCYLKGIGPVYGKSLEALGLKTFWNMLCHLPYDFYHYNTPQDNSKDLVIQWPLVIGKFLGEKPWRYLCSLHQEGFLNPSLLESIAKVAPQGFSIEPHTSSSLNSSTLSPQKNPFQCILSFFQEPKYPLKSGSFWIVRGKIQLYRGKIYVVHPKLKPLKPTILSSKPSSISSGAPSSLEQQNPSPFSASYVQGRYSLSGSITSEQFQQWIRGIFSLWPHKNVFSLEHLVHPLFLKVLQQKSEYLDFLLEHCPKALEKFSFSYESFKDFFNHYKKNHHTPSATPQGKNSLSPSQSLRSFSFCLHDVFFFLHFGGPCETFRDILYFYLACYEGLAQEVSLGLQNLYQQRREEKNPNKKSLTPPLKTISSGESFSYVDKIKQGFSYDLTPSQQKAFEDIVEKLQSPRNFCHLLQGDVGTGKSIVGFLLLGYMVDLGYKAVLMSPTQSLSYQHFRQLQQWVPVHHVLKGGKHEGTKGSPLILGTHSLLHCSWKSPHFFQGPLGLLIIDEQQRFGLKQRAQLVAQEMLKTMDVKGDYSQNHNTEENQDSPQDQGDEDLLKQEEKKKLQDFLRASPYGTSFYYHHPVHVLQMSATPIPKTLERILSGSMTMSSLEYPKNKSPVSTSLVSSKSLEDIVRLIKDKRALGQQIYWVCPSVEDKNSVEERFKFLQKIFGEDVAMVYGSMASKEKYKTLNDFYGGQKGILVSTTVVEVGLDVPKATVMVIEQAHFFGLSQLHQLRGRVGRGKDPGYCILLSDSYHQESRQRLRLLRSCSDGFLLAKEDWKKRGGGSFLGEEQSGWTNYDFLTPHNGEDILPYGQEEALKLLNQQHQENNIFTLNPNLSLLLHLFYSPFSLGLQGH